MIWIRADANREIGAGHVMRCLAIAGALKKRGLEVCFLTADESAAPLLEARGQEYRILHTRYTDMEGELDVLEGLLAGQERGFFLADSYFVTTRYFHRVREWAFVGYVDDRCLSGLPLDLLINYNIFAHAGLYAQGGRYLLGPAYVPLREEFTDVPYQVREPASRVLVTTGGSDRYNLAGRFLEKALALPGTAELEYCVVSGAFNPHFKELKELADRHPNVGIRSNVSDMSGLMQESDLAVTAGGSTMYELSAVGVPFVCFSFVDNQEPIVEGFHDRGLTEFGGNYLSQGDSMLEEAAGHLGRLAAQWAYRQQCSKRLRELVDGRGAERLAREIDRIRSGL